MGPLDGVRVVDLTVGVARSAGQLLAGLGADVVRLGRGDASPDLAGHGPLLDWWFDAGATRAAVDLGTERGRDDLRRLVARADLFIEAEPPGSLAGRGLGPVELRALNPALVHVSVTPFGSDGPRAQWQSSDLVAQAMAGWLSVTGAPDRPVALWGRQAWNLAGMWAAIEGLAGVARARRTGAGAWVDLSLHQAAVTCSEHLLMFWWFPDAFAHLGGPTPGRQRSLHWIRAYETVACRRGHCMVSPAAGGLISLIAWLHEGGFATDVPAQPAAGQLVTIIEPLMTALRQAALVHDAEELFLTGQSMHVPFGEAYSVAQVAACEQHAARGYFRAVEGHEPMRLPGPLGRFGRSPVGPPTPPPAHAVPVDDVAARWPARPPVPSPDAAASGVLPLAGVRVLDFTHVLAGPFATRAFADLGADVIRLQTAARNVGTAANDYPYNVLWGRTKRSIQLEMHHPRAAEVLRALVEQADVVVDNYSAGVLERWGAGPDRLHEWNPRIVTMSMSGCGASGPWERFVTYAPTVHALCGLTALTGPEGDDGCGPGIAFNDHVSGLIGATLLLAALHHRDATGEGQHVDVSQLEIGTWLTGPAIVDHLVTGREARAAGNRDAWTDHLVNDVFLCADGDWLAVTVDEADDDRREALAGVVGPIAGPHDAPGAVARWAATIGASAATDALQAAGIAAGRVQTNRHLVEDDPQLAARRWLVDLDSEMVGHQQTDRHPARWFDGADEIDLPYGPSAYLGQHDFEVYGQLLGWDDVAVAEAMGDGLIA